jgi:hypothetical protein
MNKTGETMNRNRLKLTMLAVAATMTSALWSPLAHAWEPTKPVEFVVPAGTGGGADQMARFIQGVVAKNNLMKQPIVVVNKSGGAGQDLQDGRHRLQAGRPDHHRADREGGRQEDHLRALQGRR